MWCIQPSNLICSFNCCIFTVWQDSVSFEAEISLKAPYGKTSLMESVLKSPVTSYLVQTIWNSLNTLIYETTVQPRAKEQQNWMISGKSLHKSSLKTVCMMSCKELWLFFCLRTTVSFLNNDAALEPRPDIWAWIEASSKLTFHWWMVLRVLQFYVSFLFLSWNMIM